MCFKVTKDEGFDSVVEVCLEEIMKVGLKLLCGI